VREAVLYSAAAYCNPVTELLPWKCQACKRIDGIAFSKPFFHVNGKSFTLGYTTFNAKTNTIITSFRGTNGLPTDPNYNSIISILNWRTNLDFTLTDYSTNKETYKNAKVHRGFLNAYGGVKDKFFKEIQELVRIHPTANILFTGHSLGGALATLATIDFYRSTNNKNILLYTFGSPRVGNNDFAKYFDSLPIKSYRVVHHDDLVPQIPLLTQNYMHVKKELWCEHNSQTCKECELNEDPTCNLSLLYRSVESHAMYLQQPITAFCNCTETSYCPNNVWGNCCENRCSSGCSGNCERTNGVCNDCLLTKWGPKFCDRSCSDGCGGRGHCDRDTGKCNDCALTRWGSVFCEKKCASGCGGRGHCDRETGKCDDCLIARWGSMFCEKNCPSGCGGRGQCERESGRCNDCALRRWGAMFCENQCNCGNDHCDRVTGACPT